MKPFAFTSSFDMYTHSFTVGDREVTFALLEPGLTKKGSRIYKPIINNKTTSIKNKLVVVKDYFIDGAGRYVITDCEIKRIPKK